MSYYISIVCFVTSETMSSNKPSSQRRHTDGKRTLTSICFTFFHLLQYAIHSLLGFSLIPDRSSRIPYTDSTDVNGSVPTWSQNRNRGDLQSNPLFSSDSLLNTMKRGIGLQTAVPKMELSRSQSHPACSLTNESTSALCSCGAVCMLNLFMLIVHLTIGFQNRKHSSMMGVTKCTMVTAVSA